jgi:hypothetical protein
MITSMESIQDFLVGIGYFFNYTLIPFLFALALLFFLVNAARYFIIGANDHGAREHARELAVYGILGFVFLVSIWGIVNAITWSLGIDYDTSVCPDYIDPSKCGDSGDSYTGSNSDYTPPEWNYDQTGPF